MITRQKVNEAALLDRLEKAIKGFSELGETRILEKKSMIRQNPQRTSATAVFVTKVRQFFSKK